MNHQELIEFYRRRDISSCILKHSTSREVVASLADGGYSSRPDKVQWPRDLEELVKRGAVAFHGSVERWSSPMQLQAGLPLQKLAKLRSGWDFILDIDSSLGLEAASTAAELIFSFLSEYEIKPACKFSGNRGFHLAIPFEAFPKKVDLKSIAKQYPCIPRALAGFIRFQVREKLRSKLIKLKGSVSALLESLNRDIDKLDPFYFVEVEKDWGSRHLFRLPGSLNEKSWLISLPIKPSQLSNFDKKDAEPARAKVKDWLQEARWDENGVLELLTSSLDRLKERSHRRKKFKSLRKWRFPKKAFPPCIKRILKGIPDGRKRSVFILITFLRRAGWPWKLVTKELKKWNERNKPPLSNTYLDQQLRWFEKERREFLPPNCKNQQFYKSFGVCPVNCKVKNPINYLFKK